MPTNWGKEFADIEEAIANGTSDITRLRDICGVGTLTFAKANSSSRAAMTSHHIPQAIIPDKPDVASVSFGSEHLFGKYSTTTKIAESDYVIVKKIRKFSWSDMVYTLLVYDKKKKNYHVLYRNEVANMCESFGCRMVNDVIDSLDEGDKIKKDTKYSVSPTIDEYDNFRYGLNAKMAFVISTSTIEDALVISTDFQKRATYTNVEKFTVNINDNYVMLNLRGDKHNYESFPEIGEFTKDCIICGTRKRVSAYEDVAMSDSALRKIHDDDDIYQAFGRYQVVDINIFANKPVESYVETKSNAQLLKYLKEIKRYYNEVYDTLNDIIDNAEKEGYTYSDELSRLWDRADFDLDENAKYVVNDGMFSNIVIEFTIAKPNKLLVGDKGAGRHGNKSVISRINTPEYMGITENGDVIDMKMDVLGILGRMNLGQIYEPDLNWLSDTVVNDIKNMTDEPTPDKFIKLASYVGRLGEYGPAMREFLVDHFESLNPYQQDEYLEECISETLKILVDPMSVEINGDFMQMMYSDIKPQKTRVKMKSRKTGEMHWVLKPMVVADMYLMILKQATDLKTSFRSKGPINPRTGVPLKSMAASKRKSLMSDQSNRIGEQELIILLLTGDIDALDYFYRTYSSSIQGRVNDSLLHQDSEDGFIIDEHTNTLFEDKKKNMRNIVVDQLYSCLTSMCYGLEIEYDTNIVEEDDLDEITDIPDSIARLFDR